MKDDYGGWNNAKLGAFGQILRWSEIIKRNGRKVKLYFIRSVEGDLVYLVVLQDNFRTGFKEKYKQELVTAYPAHIKYRQVELERKYNVYK